MKLPNAAKGVKKMFIAEILSLIGVAALAIAAVAFNTAVASYYMQARSSAAGGLAVGSVFAMLGMILPLVGVVLNLVGLRQASKDEHDRMNKAFWFGIATLVLGCLMGLFQSMRWGGVGFFMVLESLAEMCMIIFSIMGVSEVTQNISRQDVADMGPTILTVSVIAIVASIIAGILGSVFGGVAAIVSLVLMLVAYFVYLVFLGRASSALSKA